MSWPAGTTAVSNTTIASATENSFLDDLLADLNAARPIAVGGTGATSAVTARTNLGLTIGTDIQAYDPLLLAIAALTTAADKLPYFTGSDAVALADLTSYARSILAVADEAALKALINLEIGTDVESYTALQDQSTWNTGTSTTESKISPAKLSATIATQIAGAPQAVFEDQKGSGTNGGTSVAADWQTRNINIKPYDPNSLITLNANTFRPSAAGWVRWSAPAWAVNAHKTQLYNETDTAIVDHGTSEYSFSGSQIQTRSEGSAPVEANKTYRIDHYTTTAQAQFGLGVSTGISGVNETYTRVEYWRT